MIWKIQDISISQSMPQQFVMKTLAGPTYQPQNQETTADITITFRDYQGGMTLEDFEEQMKSSNLIYDGEEFNRKEIENALKEMYPERFI